MFSNFHVKLFQCKISLLNITCVIFAQWCVTLIFFLKKNAQNGMHANFSVRLIPTSQYSFVCAYTFRTKFNIGLHWIESIQHKCMLPIEWNGIFMQILPPFAQVPYCCESRVLLFRQFMYIHSYTWEIIFKIVSNCFVVNLLQCEQHLLQLPWLKCTIQSPDSLKPHSY